MMKLAVGFVVGVIFTIFFIMPGREEVDAAKNASRELALSALKYGYDCGERSRPYAMCQAEAKSAMRMQ